MIFKVAVLQMRSENRAYEENSKTIIKYMTEAKENNADGKPNLFRASPHRSSNTRSTTATGF